MKEAETKSTVLLGHHLKALKLPTMHAECEKVAARCARENFDHQGFLRLMRGIRWKALPRLPSSVCNGRGSSPPGPDRSAPWTSPSRT
jgi:hypothetical protein